MVKTLDTLVPDIFKLFTEPHAFQDDNVEEFGKRLATHVKHRIEDERTANSLRMSNLGTRCDRKLWYSVNSPKDEEPLAPEARFKFLYGDILEELVLFLAKEAGHTVEGAQDTLNIDGVIGHRDAVIDGVLVDVKSASSYSFTKFDNHLTAEQDSFGYIDQLGAYHYASKDDPLVTNKEVAAFVAVDKTLGKITVDVHPSTGKDYKELVAAKREMLAGKTPPARGFSDVEDGKSGNRKLCMECSYCSFKSKCWPNLETFAYASGPRFLTRVAKVPNVGKAF